MNELALLQNANLSWPEKLGALAYLSRKAGRSEAHMPVTHRFEPGWYIREIFVPRGTYFIGRAHRLGHRVTLDSGRVHLISETQEAFIDAPYELMTVPYFQTVFEALTDVWGSTYHPNPTGTRNVDALEEEIFFPADDVFRIGESVVTRLMQKLKELAA